MSDFEVIRPKKDPNCGWCAGDEDSDPFSCECGEERVSLGAALEEMGLFDVLATLEGAIADDRPFRREELTAALREFRAACARRSAETTR